MAVFEFGNQGLARQLEQMRPRMEERLDRSRVASFSLREWWRTRPWARAAFWCVFGATAFLTLFVGVLLMTGELGAFYEWLTGWTNGGVPWTHWIREHPRVVVPATFAVFLGLGALLIPWRLWAAAYLAQFVVFFMGFLMGHAYW